MSGFPALRPLTLPAGMPPTLLVVVDTEEEFDWTAPFDPASTATTNIAQQHRAQDLFDAHRVVPTYVVDYPVATTPDAVAVLKPWLDAGRCDIGAHLHPWVNPPFGEPVDAHHSYACNLPGELEAEKLAALTAAIERAFGRRPAIYKAGRYGVGARTPDVLRRLGYATDVSVVPHTDFRSDGGPDFTALPDRPFLAAEGLLALPMSVHFVGMAAAAGPRLFPMLARAPRPLHLPGIAARLGLLERLRLSPEGHGAADLIRQTEAALARGERLLMLTYHSSTLLPGATPYAPTAADRDRFVETLADYLGYFFRLADATTAPVREIAGRLLASTDA